MPEAFANVLAGLNADAVFYRGRLLYFRFVTLTGTGYGDIVPLHPATLLARLVSLELEGRRPL